MSALFRANDARGLTLIELLISVAILGIVAGSIPLLLDMGIGGVELQQRILDREMTYGRLFEEWSVDVAAAHAAAMVSGDCVLSLEDGDVRYVVRGDELYREMRRSGLAGWTARPMRALVKLEPGVLPVYSVNPTSASLEITGLEQPLRSVAAFRRSAS